MLVDGNFFCFGLEDEYRTSKKPNETRIPSGRYKIGLRTEGGFHKPYKNRFGFHQGMLHILEVPGFEYILIHIGNSEEDTAGCLLVGKNVKENNTVENIDRLMKIAGEMDIPLFISPHYYFPTDLDWKHGGALEEAMHNLHMFERAGQLNLDGFDGSGSDWMPQYKKYINNGKTYVSSPHKLYGPDSNDTVLQLRKRGIDQIILGGMSANLCTESHMREFLEQGFEILVVTDAVAAAQVSGYDGYAAAMTNFRMIANSVKTTDETIKKIKEEL